MSKLAKRPFTGLVASRRAFLLGLGACAMDDPLHASDRVSIPFVELPPEVQAGNAEAVQSFVGRYKHVGGAKEREALARAIEDVVAKMSPLVRGIARSRLTETNLVAPTLAISATARDVTVAYGQRGYTGPLDGRPVKVKVMTGDEMSLHYAITENEIRQVFAGDQKGSVNTYRRSEARVVRRSRVYASQLPVDLIYDLTYERA